MHKPTTPLQGALFDADGTILDSMQAQYLWLKGCAARYGGRHPFPEYGPAFLLEYNQWLERKHMPGLYEMIGVDFQKHHEKIWAEYTAFNQSHPIGPIPGVSEAIAEVFARSRVSRRRRNALRIGVNTTKTWASIEVPFRNAGLLQHLDTVVTKDDIYGYYFDGVARVHGLPFDDFETLRQHLPDHAVKTLEKPHSMASWLAAELLGVEPDAIIAFEDTTMGVASYQSVIFPRRRKDIFVVGVTWGYESDAGALFSAGAGAVIDKPAQIIEIIGDYGGLD